MDCPVKTQQNTEWLLDYAAGRLDREHAALVAQHVDACPECARFVEGQRTVWNALSQWEPEPLSADFDRRLYRAIGQATVPSWFGRIFRPLWRPLVPLAAACVLIVAGVLLHAPQAVTNSADSRPRADKVEVEQVERTLDDIEMLRELAVTPQPETNPSKAM